MKKKGIRHWDEKLIGSKSPGGVINRYVKWRDAVKVTKNKQGDPIPVAPCITCKTLCSSYNLQAGHWVSRKHKGAAYDERNIHAQCGGCNKWGAGEPQMHEDEIRAMYGDEVGDEIRSWVNKPRKWSAGELELLHEEYKDKLEKIKEEKIKALDML